MAEVKEEIKTEDRSLQDGDDHNSDRSRLASKLILKKEMKEELYYYYESDNSLQFDDFLIKPEEVDTSNVEFTECAESQDENDHRQEMQGSSASASETLESATKLNTPPAKTVNSRCVESLCRPCSVVLERLDSRTKTSAATVFSCPLCNTGFTSKFHRDHHQGRFCRRRRFNEPMKTTLTRKIPAAIALGAKHNEPGRKSRKRFTCADCGYSTIKCSHFKDHLVTHTGERRFPCTKCDFKAVRKAHLTRHLMTHGAVKPFTCADCGYRSVDKSMLSRHMRKHTRVNLFKCAQCDYASNHSGTLTRHVQGKHSKDHPFACTQCGYTCLRSEQLASHVLRHGDYKKLSCTRCKYKCNFAGNLKRHVAVKHNR